ncbi:hypothetical protein AnigIFM50267_007917 [Aspergillus niger]|nr:hypothetical protein AnigIFM50267_007917 [Aspergillus niger]
MAGLGFVNRVDEDVYQVKEVRSTLKRLPQPNMDLSCSDLIVQDLNPGIAIIPGTTMQKWNSTGEDNPQPVKGPRQQRLTAPATETTI